MVDLKNTDLDAALVNAVSSATQEVLSTMARMQVSLQNVSASPKYVPNGDISAIIGITGANGEGMLGLSFPLSLANTIVARLLGVDASQISSEDRCDAIGELANMISGKAKIAMMAHAEDVPYRLSLPTIILGQGHEVYGFARNVPFLLLSFDAEGEAFNLQVCFKINQ